MAQLVAGHLAEPGDASGAIELETHRLLAETTAVVGEEELGGLPRARMRERASLRTGGDDAVDDGDALVVEGHHAF
jgi:hypothetical protein